MNYNNKSKAFDLDIFKGSDRNGNDRLQAKQSLKEYSNKDILSGFAPPKIRDIICFSHLRWNFVFQRPQHLLSRWAREVRVFYVEEPIRGNFESNFLKTVYSKNLNLTVITPHVRDKYTEKEVNAYLKESVNEIIKWYEISDYLLWYLTPMAVEFTIHLDPKIVVYDSMDELSCFKGAHPDILPNEKLLFRLADVVFTGGYNLYEFKKNRHHNIHPFPSSIDQKHFESGIGKPEPEDQANIPGPKAGFFGVIDERLNIELLDKLAFLLPEIQFIMIGPVIKIDPETLPRHNNIHYLGQKSYEELPRYLANWDVALLPFAKNESTRFISPTKTPEYLAAGKPVVSTSIHDVVIPYGEMGLVEIADSAEEFASAINVLMKKKDNEIWHMKVKDHLKGNSWDLTWSRMKEVIYKTLEQKENMALTVNGSSHYSDHE
jgi:UDP-galactopyranose mutase